MCMGVDNVQTQVILLLKNHDMYNEEKLTTHNMERGDGQKFCGHATSMCWCSHSALHAPPGSPASAQHCGRGLSCGCCRPSERGLSMASQQPSGTGLVLLPAGNICAAATGTDLQTNRVLAGNVGGDTAVSGGWLRPNPQSKPNPQSEPDRPLAAYGPIGYWYGGGGGDAGVSGGWFPPNRQSEPDRPLPRHRKHCVRSLMSSFAAHPTHPKLSRLPTMQLKHCCRAKRSYDDSMHRKHCDMSSGLDCTHAVHSDIWTTSATYVRSAQKLLHAHPATWVRCASGTHAMHSDMTCSRSNGSGQSFAVSWMHMWHGAGLLRSPGSSATCCPHCPHCPRMDRSGARSVRAKHSSHHQSRGLHRRSCGGGGGGCGGSGGLGGGSGCGGRGGDGDGGRGGAIGGW
mmetsp:Transcript_4232/g.12183  ORF Transcript_4232/g.12183 Transcript_4232/m.12183 type:complete len:400 (-) Transcript_4232:1071-2270(-)